LEAGYPKHTALLLYSTLSAFLAAADESAIELRGAVIRVDFRVRVGHFNHLRG
jgi:hypothetical protein